MKAKGISKIKSWHCIFFGIVFLISIILAKTLELISFGADDTTIVIETSLEKYINYSISDQDRGTLVQYNVKTGINKGNNDQYMPLKSNEIAINLNQIDGQYPYAVKIITRSTELTNEKIQDFEENNQYNATNGNIIIKASNQNENGELISNRQPNSDLRDEYVIIAYYDTYTEQPEKRELNVKVKSTMILSESNKEIIQESEAKGIVEDNIGELTSIISQTDEIYNGYIKSNIINDTNYDTQYKETTKIIVSKKETQEKIEYKEDNCFLSIYKNNEDEEITQEFANNGNIVYKSTTIKQEDVKNLLGENGIIEILDSNENLLATINGNTEFGEDGKLVINYNNQPETITIKTSNIEKEGILSIENTKAIKSSMQNMNYNKIKTTVELIGKNEETMKNNQQETTEEKIVFTNNYENIIDIKESTNNVKMDVSNTQWTNQYQNDIVFNVYINSNSAKDNMLKNPIVKIELSSEVEKVILGESSLVYASELQLQEPYLETSEDGNIVIVANLVGTQTQYNENTLGLATDLKISATIILKKDIENTTENAKLIYINQYNVSEKDEIKNSSTQIEIVNYKEENTINTYANTSLFESTPEKTIENVEGLLVEVTPVRGDTVVKDGDSIYEGEYIKYNITLTNTTDEQMDNIKIVGSIPEGTTYGKLETDYNHSFADYKYNFDNELAQIDLEIGSINPGNSTTCYYEVQVNDLVDEEIEKETQAIIKTYVGSAEATNYSIKHIIKQADVQVFMGAFLDGSIDHWDYSIMVKSDKEEEVSIDLQFPIAYQLEYKVLVETGEVTEVSADSDGKFTDTIKTNKVYNYGGIMSSEIIRETYDKGPVELTATATVTVNEMDYKSNENRIQYEFENVDIQMSSETEGEEVKFEDSINYEITATVTGKTNLEKDGSNMVLVNIKDFLPKGVIPISITYDTWVETQEDSYEYIKQTVQEDLSNYEDEEGNKLAAVDQLVLIPYGETSIIKIETIADMVYEKTKIENSATAEGTRINTKTSNIVSHTILPYNYDDQDDEIESTDPNNPSDSNNSGNSTNQGNTNDTNNSEGLQNIQNSGNAENISGTSNCSISGAAWLDENEDGKRQIDEKLLEGISVILVDSNNPNTIKERVITDSNGTYSFSGLTNGSYIVVFNYNTEMYTLTDYQKSGVSSNINSDAINKEITLLGDYTKVGLTDTIYLNTSVSNIDIGLVENKICDLKLEKYISKVQVQTVNGTSEYNYDNAQLAKVEIKSKEIQGATVVVTYTIVITNEGEIPTYVTKVVDYLPEGFEFSSNLNSNWSKTKSGELINTTLGSQSIGSGESLQLTLILTKTMTSTSTGTFTNIAEIGEIRNTLEISDTDSTPGNNVLTEDDYSKADLILSVSTGGIVYVISIVIIIIVLSIIAYLLFKNKIVTIEKLKKISKIGLFIFAVCIIIASNQTETLAADKYKINQKYNINGKKITVTKLYSQKAEFTYDKNGSHRNKYGSRCFNGTIYNATENGSLTAHADCTLAGAATWNREYILLNSTYSNAELKLEKTSGTKSLSLTKSNVSSTMEADEDGYVGPFTFTSNAEVNITAVIVDNKNTSPKTTYSKEGNKHKYNIYVKDLGNGKHTIKINVQAKQAYIETYIMKGNGNYKPNTTGTYQPVVTVKKFNLLKGETDAKIATKSVSWSTNVQNPREIEVSKTDENGNSQENVGFYVFDTNSLGYIIANSDNDGKYHFESNDGIISANGDENQDNEPTLFKTNSSGKFTLTGLEPKIKYIIIEVSSFDKYSYRLQDSTVLFRENEEDSKKAISIINQRNTGNVKINKIDYDNPSKKLEGIHFKIKKLVNVGDINGDGDITYYDKILLQQCIAGYSGNEYGYLFDEDEKLKIEMGDVNGDGKIDINDVSYLEHYLNNEGGYSLPDKKIERYISINREDDNLDGTINTHIKVNSMIGVNSTLGTEFVTNYNGEINISNLLTGQYILEELYVGDNYGYEPNTENVSLQYSIDSGTTWKESDELKFEVIKQSPAQTDETTNIVYKNQLNVFNKKQTGNLQIIKKDKNSEKSLKGVSFKIRQETDSALDINKDGKIDETDSNILQEYIAKTGEIPYYIAPYSYGDCDANGKIDMNDVTYISRYIYGLVPDVKVLNYMQVIDEKGHVYAGETVTGKITLSNFNFTPYPDDATTFITDDNGEINILNLLKGTYVLEEISVGDNFGYDSEDDEKITYVLEHGENKDEEKSSIGNGKIEFTVERQSSTETSATSNITYHNKLNVYNKLKWIKLSGYAWEDILDSVKTQDRDNVYDTDKGKDERLNNIAVRLIKSDGSSIETITSYHEGLGNGSFVFGDYIQNPSTKRILVEDLENGAYIQFYYNGLNYETVEMTCIAYNEQTKQYYKIPNGNTAREFKQENNREEVNLREKYNNNYTSIKHEGTYNNESKFAYTFDYNEEANSSTLIYPDEARYGYDGANYPILTSYRNTEHSDKFLMTARTETNIDTTNGYNPETYRLLGQNRTIQQLLEDENFSGEIENINLGLYEREQPDLSLEKDLHSIKVSINGYDHVYLYNSYYTNYYKESNSDVGVEWGYEDLRKGKAVSYTSAIYRSDYQWENPVDVSKELKLYVTYELKIINESTSLISKVNSIVDYYDANYTDTINIGSKVNEGIVENDNSIERSIDDSYNVNGYKKLIIEKGIEIAPEKSQSIYIQFELTREKVGEIIHKPGEESEGELLENVAEINSYSTYYDGKIYAGIDKDSRPGNYQETGNYEDDTFSSPALKLEESETERSISGTVFLDNSNFQDGNSKDTHTGETRNGDGIYDEEQENTISGVTVKLYKNFGENFNVWSQGQNYITGNASGTTEYLNKDNEVIVGSKTTDSSGKFKITGFIPGEYVIVYTWGNNTYIQGDEGQPINVSDYKGTIYINPKRADDENLLWYQNNQTNNSKKTWYKADSERYSDAVDNYKLRENIDKGDLDSSIMLSRTPTMDFAIEYGDNNKKGESDGLNKDKFEVSNIDFGITERARQEIAIDKAIKSVKITLANGQVIAQAQTNEDGKLEIITGAMQNIKRDYANPNVLSSWYNGMIREEIDSELIQGAILEVTYQIKVDNNSEKDYYSETYYIYGTEPEDEKTIIKQTPTVYDYLAENLVFDVNKQEETSKFEIVTKNSKTEEKTLLVNYLINAEKKDGVLTTISGYEYFSEEYKEKIESWATNSTEIYSISDTVFSDRIILKIKGLETQMLPDSHNELLLYASKVLSSKEDLEINNDIEVTKVTRSDNYGRKVTPATSIIYNRGETIVVTNPTGDNQNYLPYIILGITSFMLLGVGVVLIKKKIL